MPGTFLGYPFDSEIFLMNWQAAQDPVRTAMIDSGAVQRNRTIERMIANGSNLYTVPFYNVLGGDDDNYDGQTDMLVSAPTGASQTGVVYGRMHAWKDQDFIRDFNSGANPMLQISSQVAKYWNKKRQSRLVGIMNGVFGIADDSTDFWDAWQLHTLNIALAASGTVSDANKVDVASAADAMQKAVGDNSSIFSMAVMHSAVANTLAKKQLLEFRKYTDAAGIERTTNIADWNGLTVIVDDGVPTAQSSSATGEMEYTTYLFGRGALLGASAPVKTPVETGRETKKYGGYDYLINRLRETIHPNGFSWTMDMASVSSPTDVNLGNTSNWKLVADPKLIPMARLITNG